MKSTKTLGPAREDASTADSELPKELYVKHPLQNTWCLWFFRNDRSRTWEDNLMKISSFDTVEDFWALFNHLENPSKLPVGCDYSLFKDGIKPMWEDSRNVNGGRWLVTFSRQERCSELDNCWYELLMCMIGGNFDPFNDDICGAVVQIRNRGDKLALWTPDVKRGDAILRIGRTMRDRLGLAQGTLSYEMHEMIKSKTGAIHKV